MFAKLDYEPTNQNPQLNNTNNNKSNEENKNEESPKNQDEIDKLIKEIPLNNLNDYYDIETNLFKKRIEKLNLKFYWIYESVLGEETTNNLLYPYNKLFLILFKEISLYIEEILRLNKQLNLKSKNEKFYIQKINDYKKKEKDFLLNKQKIKIIEKNLKISEKNNEKLKNEIDKLNKKIMNTNNSIFNSNSNFAAWKNNLSNNRKFNIFNKTSTKLYNGNITEQGSIMSSGSNNLSNRNYINKKNKSKELTVNINNNNGINSNSSLYTKTTNVSSGNNNNFIYLGITQCEDEINNLNLIENLLMKYYKKKSLTKRKIQSYKKLSPERINNINNETNFSSFKKKLYTKKIKNKNKSLDYKTNIINIGNKY